MGSLNPKIFAITPCSRPENLKHMSETLSAPFEWYVALDKKVQDKVQARKWVNNPKVPTYIYAPDITGNSGNGLRNFLLDIVMTKAKEDDWIYFLDDDNVVHENLLPIFNQKRVRGADMLLVPQVTKEGNYRLMPPLRPRVGVIDSAMMVLRAGHVQSLRWHPTEYSADGIYAEEASKKAKIVMDNRAGCYYNFLR